MNTLEDAELEGKKVILRTDLNLPVENGEPQETVRFKRYLNTIEKLSERGAKTLVLAHQGRPGRNDFLSLEKHSEHLEENLGQEVEFLESFFGDQLSKTLGSMESGDVALLENVRFLSEELRNATPGDHSNDIFVQRIAEEADIFVDDGFSAAHRSHGSIVGFTPLLDSYSGPVMEKELESGRKVRDELDDPVLVLGGEKPSDIIGMLEEMIEKVDKVLLGGIPGELALIVQEHDLGEKGEWIEQKGFDSKRGELEELLNKYEEKIELPEDLATEDGNFETGEVPEDSMTWDIGEKTTEKYVSIIRNADSVLMKGPMGAFEQHEEGTKKVVDAIGGNNGFTVLGGGHTSSLVQRFGHELDDFSHVSIAGGAFVRLMSGEKLAAVEALEKYS